MRTSVICVNDFPEMAFPPGTPDAVVEEQQAKLQAKYDFEDLGFSHPRKKYVHTQEVNWYGGTQ